MKHWTKTAKSTLFCRPSILHRAIRQVLKPHPRRWANSVLGVSLLCLPPPVSVLDLADLDGINGFVINGISDFDGSGSSVSGAGDINGDGIEDLIIGALNTDPNGTSNAGESYVVFGQAGGFASSLSLADLDGANGFVISGVEEFDTSGATMVSGAGDVNGDGFDDLIIGDQTAGPPRGLPPLCGTGAGEGYVVFGQADGFAARLNLADLDGANGFVISGVENPPCFPGISVSGAGDVNGDGFADLIIGAHYANPNGDYTGGSYVVFGQADGFVARLNLADLDGANGFVISGVDVGNPFRSVSGAGDINGDGIEDLIIGAPLATPNGNEVAGESYVVFGREEPFAARLSITDLDGINGFVLNGVDAYDQSGSSVSGAGDINGDGIDDLIIGAPRAVRNGNNAVGESYVVFGQEESFDASVNLADLDGTNGFVISGVDSFDESGSSVSGAGDINGDGIDDLIIGAPYTNPDGDYAGESYVVFGQAGGFAASLNLADLDGTNGFVLSGVDADDRSGSSVSGAGDINGDGIEDLIIGAPGADNAAGESYVVFGKRQVIDTIGFIDTIGLYDPVAGVFHLKLSLTGGKADIAYRYGPAYMGLRPVMGDWDGDGVDTAGLFNQPKGIFYLKNEHGGGAADNQFRYGPVGFSWEPVIGDWNGDGMDTVGLYNPYSGTFFLKDDNRGGIADYRFRFGPVNPNLIPLAGDWDGDGQDTVGLYDQATGVFFLKNAHRGGKADVSFRYGPANVNWEPVVGDWNGNGEDTIGLYSYENGRFYLRDTNTPGVADRSFRYGPLGQS